MMILDNLKNLRKEMEVRGIDLYLVPTADFHGSEYVGEHFKARAYLTGFTGSNGTCVITKDFAGLWTDARYYLQAEAQLEGTTIELFRMSDEGVITIADFIRENLPAGGVLGFDGRVLSAAEGRGYEEIVREKGGCMKTDEDLVDLIWKDRPPMACSKAWVLAEEYSGQSVSDKLAEIRKVMADNQSDIQLITCLYDISWILNIRGDDITYVPVILSNLAITRESCIWFVQESALDSEVLEYLGANGIDCRPYEDFYSYIGRISAGSRVWIDSGVLNYRLYGLLPEDVDILDRPVPSVLMRSVKNEKEQKNAVIAHEKDAVAMIRFMHWVKTNTGKIPITEVSASDYLASLRAKQEHFIELSFSTIAGYADHGAIVHYKATEETDRPLKPESLFLVDSGGHYLEGTTDITRTFALGPVSDRMKSDFTRVLRSMLNLADVKFLKGCTGENLDVLARLPLWEAGMDFKHGTGHGVGCILNVHEGPQSFRWNSKRPSAPFRPGMITSDEPGIYIAGQYGIRTENEILCVDLGSTEYGHFYGFRHLTYVPIDLDAVNVAELSDRERRLLNEYHRSVYERMADKIPEELRDWFAYYTREV